MYFWLRTLYIQLGVDVSRQAPEPWYAVVSLCSVATANQRLEGAALGHSAQAGGTFYTPCHLFTGIYFIVR